MAPADKTQATTPDPFKASSTPYMEAGEAMRAAFRKANASMPRLNGTQHRTLNAVASLTGAFSKLHDRTSLAEISEIADFPKGDIKNKTAAKALKELSLRGIILYTPGTRGRKTQIGLPPAGSAAGDA